MDTKHTATTQPESLLDRLDRVGMHQSVAARYCKEAAAEIRQIRNAHDDLVKALQAIRPYLNAGEALIADAELAKAGVK